MAWQYFSFDLDNVLVPNSQVMISLDNALSLKKHNANT